MIEILPKMIEAKQSPKIRNFVALVYASGRGAFYMQ
jgi:hypothetical protein